MSVHLCFSILSAFSSLHKCDQIAVQLYMVFRYALVVPTIIFWGGRLFFWNYESRCSSCCWSLKQLRLYSINYFLHLLHNWIQRYCLKVMGSLSLISNLTNLWHDHKFPLIPFLPYLFARHSWPLRTVHLNRNAYYGWADKRIGVCIRDRKYLNRCTPFLINVSLWNANNGWIFVDLPTPKSKHLWQNMYTFECWPLPILDQRWDDSGIGIGTFSRSPGRNRNWIDY